MVEAVVVLVVAVAVVDIYRDSGLEPAFDFLVPLLYAVVPSHHRSPFAFAEFEA